MPEYDNNNTTVIRTSVTLHNERDKTALKLLEQSSNKSHTIRELIRHGIKMVTSENIIRGERELS